jgi:hypothetical protein
MTTPLSSKERGPMSQAAGSTFRTRVAAGVCAVALSASCLLGTKAAAAATPGGGSFTFAAVGDQGASANAQAVMASVGSRHVDFAQSLGDLDYAQMAVPDWCTLVKKTMTVPFMMVAGNHESREKTSFTPIEDYTAPGCLANPLGGQVVESPLIDKQPKGTTNYGKEYYYDYPAVNPTTRFIVLSPNENFNLNGGAAYDYTAGSAHFAWASRAIDEAKAKGEWVIAVYHEPYLNAGGHGNADEPFQDLFTMLLTKKVDLILNGHDHNYQRSKQLTLGASCPVMTKDVYNATCAVHAGTSADPYARGAGTVEVIAGTGGGNPYPMNPADGDMPYFTTTMGLEGTTFSYGYLAVQVTSSGISATFVNTAETTFADSFAISSAAPTETASAQPTASAEPTASAQQSVLPAAPSGLPSMLVPFAAGVGITAVAGGAIWFGLRRRSRPRRGRRAI